MRLLDVRADHVRFGFSPLRECLRAIEVFLHPGHHAEQLPWVREARRRVPRTVRERLEDVRFFVEPRIETFAFAWPAGDTRGFEDELETLRGDLPRYRDAVVKRLSGARLFAPDDLRALRRAGWYRPAAAAYARRSPGTAAFLARFAASPARSLRAFCDVVEEFYGCTIAHRWSAFERRLTDDIAMRRQIARDRGVGALLRTLSREIAVSGPPDRVVVACRPDAAETRFTDRSSLLLTPSFFCWPHVELFVQKTSGGARATIAYPLPPLPARARPSLEGALLVDACKALGDPVRLRIVELLRGRDLSTRELAGFLRLSEPAVSRHLSRLARAGLIAPARDGYFVLYRLRRDALERITAQLAALG